eukprot:763616-Hanusia_phi.AAC.5
MKPLLPSAAVQRSEHLCPQKPPALGKLITSRVKDIEKALPDGSLEGEQVQEAKHTVACIFYPQGGPIEHKDAFCPAGHHPSPDQVITEYFRPRRRPMHLHHHRQPNQHKMRSIKSNLPLLPDRRHDSLGVRDQGRVRPVLHAEALFDFAALVCAGACALFLSFWRRRVNQTKER